MKCLFVSSYGILDFQEVPTEFNQTTRRWEPPYTVTKLDSSLIDVAYRPGVSLPVESVRMRYRTYKAEVWNVPRNRWEPHQCIVCCEVRYDRTWVRNVLHLAWYENERLGHDSGYDPKNCYHAGPDPRFRRVFLYREVA